MVLRARQLGWSREAAATALVARADVTPFGRLLLFPPSCARCHYCLCLAEGSMKQDQRKGKRLPVQLATVNLHAAGIDIGAQEHGVAVPPDSDPQPVRAPAQVGSPPRTESRPEHSGDRLSGPPANTHSR